MELKILLMVQPLGYVVPSNTEDINVFNMITAKNESKTLAKR